MILRRSNFVRTAVHKRVNFGPQILRRFFIYLTFTVVLLWNLRVNVVYSFFLLLLIKTLVYKMQINVLNNGDEVW